VTHAAATDNERSDERHPGRKGPTRRYVVEHFQPDTSEIGRARRFVRRTLDAWGLHKQVPAFELSVSELVTNAIMHGRGVIELKLATAGSHVRLEVSDDGPSGVTEWPADSSALAAGGRGLRIVEHEMDRWGTSSEPDRTVVWLEKQTDGRAHPDDADVDG
jgi:anti-sigma regulatory factor (Ser/Thr protein kinase)